MKLDVSDSLKISSSESSEEISKSSLIQLLIFFSLAVYLHSFTKTPLDNSLHPF